MYNPIIGRWISSDPLTKRDGPSVVRSFVAMRIPSALVLRWETYRYASNNPTNSIDPSGLYSLNDAVEEDCHNVLSHQDSAAYRDVPYTRRMKECRDILWKDRQLVFQIWYELEKKDLATWHKDLPDCPCTITAYIKIRPPHQNLWVAFGARWAIQL
ncbi:MAG: RHS repeat-associated core domain-containing protein, partial [Planctomycetales bacterium]